MAGNMQQTQAVGTTQIMTWVMKIFGIIGMIFIGISLAVPWANYTEPGTIYGLSLNGWGLSTNIPSTGISTEIYKYFSDPFYINTMQAGIAEGTVAGICMILVFVFTIITLLLSIKAFRTIGIGATKNYLITGIFSIVTIVLCVIGVIQANAYGSAMYYGLSGTTVAGGFGYTWAFILTIIAMIFFFINYAVPKFLLQPGGIGMQQSWSPQQQPQVMYTSQQPPMQQTPPPQQPVEQAPLQQPTQKKPKTGAHFCPACGAQLQAGTKFCPGCGAKI